MDDFSHCKIMPAERIPQILDDCLHLALSGERKMRREQCTAQANVDRAICPPFTVPSREHLNWGNIAEIGLAHADHRQ